MEEVHLSDYLSNEQTTRRRKLNKFFYRKYDPLQEHNEKEFRAKYRMTKASFRRLNAAVSPLLSESIDNRGNPTPADIKLLIALRFYATGSFHYFNGEVIGFCASHVCTVVSEVSEAIASLLPAYVKFPSRQEMEKVCFAGLIDGSNSNLQDMEEFEKIAGFPNVWGAIDGTHVEVVVPAEHRTVFYNRKSRTSLNLQVVVGSDMRIIDLVNRWPGSVHDSRIFLCSRLNRDLLQNPPPGHMLGDAGYACLPYLLTPLRHSQLTTFTPTEAAFQKSHIKTRNLVERTFGAWKAKFQCLKGMRLKLSTTMNVISACAVIWNFLLAEKDPLSAEEIQAQNTGSDDDEDELSQLSENDMFSRQSMQSSAGRAKRDSLISAYFSTLV